MPSISRNKIFELLDAQPTNPQWSWCAISPDNKRAVFTLWEDELSGSNYRFSAADYDVRYRLGESDQERILERVIKNNIPSFGLICVAENITSVPRKIKEVKSDYIIKLAINKDSAGFYGKRGEKILLPELVQNIVRMKQLSRNALMDLGAPPDGCDMPDRALTVGTTVVRDEKVRAFVVALSGGKCEYCNTASFVMTNGLPYIEAHHIIALSQLGKDTVNNVIALCPEHHREAHYGASAEALETAFITIVNNRHSKYTSQF